MVSVWGTLKFIFNLLFLGGFWIGPSSQDNLVKGSIFSLPVSFSSQPTSAHSNACAHTHTHTHLHTRTYTHPHSHPHALTFTHYLVSIIFLVLLHRFLHPLSLSSNSTYLLFTFTVGRCSWDGSFLLGLLVVHSFLLTGTSATHSHMFKNTQTYAQTSTHSNTHAHTLTHTHKPGERNVPFYIYFVFFLIFLYNCGIFSKVWAFLSIQTHQKFGAVNSDLFFFSLD